MILSSTSHQFDVEFHSIGAKIMTRNSFLNSLLEAMPKPLSVNDTEIHHRNKSKGSPIDKYRCEILALRHQCHCSYGEIVLWLKHKKNISISKKTVYQRIKYWNEVTRDGSNKN